MFPPDRNLAVELVRATEAGAMGAARLIGHGDNIVADQAAVDTMRAMLDTVDMQGVVVIGEGEKDEAPMLYNGERVGSGTGPEMDVAVDPLEGTELDRDRPAERDSVIAASNRGSMFFPGPAVDMEKTRGRTGGGGSRRHERDTRRERAARCRSDRQSDERNNRRGLESRPQQRSRRVVA